MAGKPLHLRYEGMSAAERVWFEQLCRKLGLNPVVGPLLDEEGRKAANELLGALSSATPDEETQRLGKVLRQHQRRVEDEHAERLGLPPRPR